MNDEKIIIPDIVNLCILYNILCTYVYINLNRGISLNMGHFIMFSTKNFESISSDFGICLNLAYWSIL